jgi:excisionase family DNA binding protein
MPAPKVPTTAPRLLTVAEAAARLGLCEEQIRRLLKRGELRETRLAKRAVRVAEDDLAAFVESKRPAK